MVLALEAAVTLLGTLTPPGLLRMDGTGVEEGVVRAVLLDALLGVTTESGAAFLEALLLLDATDPLDEATFGLAAAVAAGDAATVVGLRTAGLASGSGAFFRVDARLTDVGVTDRGAVVGVEPTRDTFVGVVGLLLLVAGGVVGRVTVGVVGRLVTAVADDRRVEVGVVERTVEAVGVGDRSVPVGVEERDVGAAADRVLVNVVVGATLLRVLTRDDPSKDLRVAGTVGLAVRDSGARPSSDFLLAAAASLAALVAAAGRELVVAAGRELVVVVTGRELVPVGVVDLPDREVDPSEARPAGLAMDVGVAERPLTSGLADGVGPFNVLLLSATEDDVEFLAMLAAVSE